MVKRILFTGVGRRIELLQAFRQAALNMNVDLKIYGVDMLETAPGLYYCDYSRIVCGMQDDKYIPQLLRICEEDNIDLLIPTIDTDLLLLAKNENAFKEIGTKVLISKQDKIAICRDKNYTADFFESCELMAPRTYNDWKKYEGPYPCFIKPKDGSSSIDAYKVQTLEELITYAEKIGDYIIQPFIDGVEYTVDIFCDFNANPIYITPRIRKAVRAGEVLKTEIVLDEKIIEESKKIIKKFMPIGPMTVQLIRQNNTGDDYFIEINPRYGGGAPLSMKAGARSAETVLKMLLGKHVEYQSTISEGAIFSRFDQSVCIVEGKKQKIKGVIFDLDDTLYSEKQYVRSGYNAVAEYLGSIEYADKLWEYFQQGNKAIDELLLEKGFMDKKEECLKVYREHTPQIHLYEGIMEKIRQLKSKGIKIGIITDGRIDGQKKKIHALGIDQVVDDIIITDELGGIQFRKPNDIAFRIMQCRWRIPFEQIVYIGDNLNKDFQAPKQLGMQYVWYQNDDGIYKDKRKRPKSSIIEIIENLFIE